MHPGRRRFEHLWVELSLALDRSLPRFPLWLALREAGADPEDLSRGEAVAFCRDGLADFLRERGLALPVRASRRLTRRVARFEARHPTPEEQLTALTG